MARITFAFRERCEAELYHLDRWLSEGMRMADIGACLGLYTVSGSRLVGPRGLVVAIEPAAAAFEILEENLRLNDVRNAAPFRMALADRPGESTLFHHPDPSRNSLGTPESGFPGSETVRVSTLDAILSEAGLDGLDVVKMDVEGAEELVLRGGRTCITRDRPTVLFEVNPEAARSLGLSPRGAWDHLAALGYEFFVMSRHGELRRLWEPPPGGNVLAFPGARS